jgi:hypothetical protein
LETILKKFLGHCLDFVKARSFDKDQFLSQIQAGVNTQSSLLNPTYGNSSLSAHGWNDQQQQFPGSYQQPQPGVWNPNSQSQFAPNTPQQQHHHPPPHQSLPGTWVPPK